MCLALIISIHKSPTSQHKHDAFFTVSLFVREKWQKFRNTPPAQSNLVDTGWPQQKSMRHSRDNEHNFDMEQPFCIVSKFVVNIGGLIPTCKAELEIRSLAQVKYSNQA
jgi:hypothetical protein